MEDFRLLVIYSVDANTIRTGYKAESAIFSRTLSQHIRLWQTILNMRVYQLIHIYL